MSDQNPANPAGDAARPNTSGAADGATANAGQAAGAQPGQQAQGQPQAAPQAAPQAKKLAPGDHEFLPAALEILETPPSPVRVALIWAICALFVVALAWSWFGRLDIVAIASGKFQPAGRVRLVQPSDPGKVDRLFVHNGSKVAKDDILVQLSTKDAEADVAALTAALAAVRAEIAWRKTFAGVLQARAPEPMPAVRWEAGASEANGETIPAHIRLREEQVYRSGVGQLATLVQSFRAQRVQKLAERARLVSTIASQTQYVATLRERVDMRDTLVKRNAGARAAVIDALEKYHEQQTELARQKGQIDEIDAALAVLDKEIDKTYHSFDADNAQKLSAAERKHDELVQSLAKAKTKRDGMTIKAPEAGTVQALSIVNAGQVVSAGEHIMRIVPEGAELEVEAYVLNKDIGFIKEGQEAVIKVESFPFTRYGTIAGKVVRIARDAISQPEAAQAEANPGQPNAAPGPGGAQRTQNLVFSVIVRPDKTFLTADGVKTPMSPGMTVAIEIKTGKRRILEYVFAPLIKTSADALKER